MGGTIVQKDPFLGTGVLYYETGHEDENLTLRMKNNSKSVIQSLINYRDILRIFAKEICQGFLNFTIVSTKDQIY